MFETICYLIWILRWQFFGSAVSRCWTRNRNPQKAEGSQFCIFWRMIDQVITSPHCVNTLRSRQDGRRFADDTFKRIFLNENVRISIKISLKFIPKGPIINIPALVQIMAWRRSGDKPLSEAMMVSLPTHICVTRPQWVKLGWVGCYPIANDPYTICQMYDVVGPCQLRTCDSCLLSTDHFAK